MKRIAAVMTTTLLMLAASHAQAQSVWRCTEGERVEYQAEPCHGGRAVEAPMPRPAQDESEARRIAGRQALLAERLRAERLQRDAQPVPLAAGIPYTKTELSPSKKPQQPSKHQPQRDADEGTWQAKRPSSRQSPG